jgi:short-subunit dehydrogenase
MRIAVITGASSGMGREYALLADKEGIYDEIWAIARRRERLQELVEKCTTKVRPISMDLTEEGAISELGRMFAQAASEAAGAAGPAADESGPDTDVVASGPTGAAATADAAGPAAVADASAPAAGTQTPTDAADPRFALGGKAGSKASDAFEIGLLVNTAGFGKFGTYADMTCEEVDRMIDLNCRALVDITQLALPYMRRGDRIIEFASSASFQPLPGLNVYAASKGFVRMYARALRFELRGTGIHVTAVCPLWVKTEFIQVARQTANGSTVRHPFPMLSAKHVVRWSTFINKINYPIATCCITGTLMRICDKIIPNPLIMWIWEGLRRI